MCFRGQIKAYVTRDSWHPVGDFAELGAEDPEYRLVALMSVYAQNVLIDPEGVYTEQDAIAYALGELVPHELLERDLPNPSHTAAALCLPGRRAHPPEPPRAARRDHRAQRRRGQHPRLAIGRVTCPLPRAAARRRPTPITFACGRTGAASVR